MSGLFSTFNIGRSGLNTAQTTIDVTSHNVANVNTEGYSRQRAEIITSRPANATVGQVGTGSQVQAIERVRDSFLDYQVRGESSAQGQADVRNDMLYQVENIFNEPSDTGISSLMGKFFDGFQELSKQSQNSNARTVVAQQTLALTDALNHAATKLDELKSNAQMLLKANVTDVNSMLDQINSLNKEIMSVETAGQTPNDLMDNRDKLLDELSYKFGIKVESAVFQGADVKATDAGGMKSANLVSSSPNTDVARFSYISSIEEDPNSLNTQVITYYKLGDMSNEKNKQIIRVTGLSAEEIQKISETRVLWADESGQVTKADGYPIKDNDIILASELMVFTPKSGEISGNISVQADIENYNDQLDKLAMSIAFSVNAIHSGLANPINTGGDPEIDNVPFFVNSDIAQYDSNNNLINVLETLNGESGISAKNITISKEILEDVMKIKTKTHDSDYGYTSENEVDGEGDGARALAIAQLRDTQLKVQSFGVTILSRSDMFNTSKGGTTLSNHGMDIASDTSGMQLDSYYMDQIDKLGIQAQEASRISENQETLVGQLENNRESVSGVSLDEEMANLIQFQHAYSANAKIISTIDELLDVVINGLKR
ncbi:flagellar hook-associated protein FlgK [Clostridium vincentii]|uniref:Flagellar hook-associated protein 1 n=1 Tax=Clostridium vincentii TaxID=52704 RepID=A0A2T0BG67_9CLOT|nr:flagellar hook-associated protein FlgK [Clostridium vincentii]PRR82833.1 Flagellar hook-associated protein 1 [Clostridium vincentii]